MLFHGSGNITFLLALAAKSESFFTQLSRFRYGSLLMFSGSLQVC
jgi:hypothetical protein